MKKKYPPFTTMPQLLTACKRDLNKIGCITLVEIHEIKYLTSNWVGQLFWQGASAHFKHLKGRKPHDCKENIERQDKHYHTYSGMNNSIYQLLKSNSPERFFQSCTLTKSCVFNVIKIILQIWTLLEYQWESCVVSFKLI